MRKDHREALRYAEMYGISEARIVPKGKHLALAGIYEGQPVMFLLSNSVCLRRPAIVRDDIRRFVKYGHKRALANGRRQAG